MDTQKAPRRGAFFSLSKSIADFAPLRGAFFVQKAAGEDPGCGAYGGEWGGDYRWVSRSILS